MSIGRLLGRELRVLAVIEDLRLDGWNPPYSLKRIAFRAEELGVQLSPIWTAVKMWGIEGIPDDVQELADNGYIEVKRVGNSYGIWPVE